MDSHRDATRSHPGSGRRARSAPGDARSQVTLRRMLLGAIVLVLVQSAVGMAVNLYVTVPGRHSGARPSNYLSGSFDSVTWAIAHGAVALAVHAALGLAVVIVVIGVTVRALRSRRPPVAAWTTLASLLVIGAGFNGASFLDFGNNISSLIMALLAFGAIGCYSAALFLIRSPAP